MVVVSIEGAVSLILSNYYIIISSKNIQPNPGMRVLKKFSRCLAERSEISRSTWESTAKVTRDSSLHSEPVLNGVKK